MLNSFSGTFAFGRRPEVGGLWDPWRANPIAWFDASDYSTVTVEKRTTNGLGGTYPVLAEWRDLAGDYVATGFNSGPDDTLPFFSTGYNYFFNNESGNFWPAPGGGSGHQVEANVAMSPPIDSIWGSVANAAHRLSINSLGPTWSNYRVLSKDSGWSIPPGPPDRPVTFSIYLKSDYSTSPKVGIGISDSGGTIRGVKFNLPGNAVEGVFNTPFGSTNTPTDASIEEVGGGWYRVSITVLSQQIYSFNFWFIQTLDGIDSINLTTTEVGYFMFGPQIELGDSPGPYATTGVDLGNFTADTLSPIGKPLVVFYSTLINAQGGHFDISPGIPLTRAMSVFSVFKRGGDPAEIYSGPLVGILENSSDQDLQSLSWAATHELSIGFNENESPVQFGSDSTVGEFFITGSIMDSSNLSLWLDGIQSGTTQSAPADPTGQVFDLIGKSLRASLCEIIVCSRAVSSLERQKFEGYLAWKWGLEDKLDPSHPYKSSPPTL